MKQFLVLISIVISTQLFAQNEMETELSSKGVIYTDKIIWDYNSSQISKFSFNALNSIVEYLKNNTKKKLEITIFDIKREVMSSDLLPAKVKRLEQYFKDNGVSKECLKVIGCKFENSINNHRGNSFVIIREIIER